MRAPIVCLFIRYINPDKPQISQVLAHVQSIEMLRRRSKSVQKGRHNFENKISNVKQTCLLPNNPTPRIQGTWEMTIRSKKRSNIWNLSDYLGECLRPGSTSFNRYKAVSLQVFSRERWRKNRSQLQILKCPRNTHMHREKERDCSLKR